MSALPMSPLKTTSHLAIHVFYVTLAAVFLLLAHAWLQEHDARLQATAEVKVSVQREQVLQKQIASLQADAARKVQAIHVRIAKIKTAPQAIAAIPELSNLPLHAALIPSMPESVSVDAVALAQELGECKVTRIELDSCQEQSKAKDGIITEGKTQIAILTKRPSFWRRVGSQVKSGSIFISVGIVLAKVVL